MSDRFPIYQSSAEIKEVKWGRPEAPNKKYPLDELEVNQSFSLPFENEKQFNNLRTYISKYGKRHKKKFRAMVHRVTSTPIIEVARIE